MKINMFVVAIALIALLALAQATPLVYRFLRPSQLKNLLPKEKRNAELINGLIGMDLNTLSAIGKRSNAELINGLLGMNLNKLSSAGKR